MRLAPAVGNLADKVAGGGVADLTRMPRTGLRSGPLGTLYRYSPLPGVEPGPGPPVLLVPPLGAPDFAYDLRRGCSLVEHLLSRGRRVHLVDYGSLSFAERGLGMEHWVDEVVPTAVDDVVADAGGPVDLVAWSLGGIFALLAVAAAAQDGAPLQVRSVTAIGSPIDISAVPLVAPLRPFVAVAGGGAVAAVYRLAGSFPAPVVSWAFHLTAIDRLVTKPLVLLSRLDDRDFLAQIEAVDHLMDNMNGYPGRVFGQIYHLMLRNNDLSDGGLALGGRRIALSAVDVPVLVVAGRRDVIAPLRAVHRVTELLTGSPDVRFATAPGGHLGVLTGREARTSTWARLDEFLDDLPAVGSGAATPAPRRRAES